MLAIVVLKRAAFTKMVKDSKKKSDGGEVEELEIEIGSNEISDLDEQEKKLVRKISEKMKEEIESHLAKLDGKDEVEGFAKFALEGSLRVIASLSEKLKPSDTVKKSEKY